jgi:hypothetical protein
MGRLRNVLASVLSLVAVFGMQAASAASPYAAIETAVDWSDVVTGIVAIAALVAAVLVVMRGSRMLLRMIGR